jgi:predicted RNA-binding Zn-ribbon protein involved in translation (DUF1610 family)
MTFNYFEKGPERAYRCPNCGGMMQEDSVVMGVQIYRCPFCGEWKEE